MVAVVPPIEIDSNRMSDEQREEVYRLRTLRITGGSSSSSEFEYFTSWLSLERATLEAMIRAIVESRADRESVESRTRWLACLNWARMKGEESKKTFVKAEHYVDGRWVELKPTLVVPHLVWDHESA